MKLYEFGPTRSIRARWTLQELGVDFDAVRVDLTRWEHCTPDFLLLNPAGKVPLLIDGDLVLCESVAIVLYLAEKYPDRGFIPADLKLRADFYRWILFAVTALEQPWWRIAKHTHLYPEQDRLPAEVALARRDFPVPARRSPRAGRHSLTGPIKRHSHCFTCLPLTRPWAGDW